MMSTMSVQKYYGIQNVVLNVVLKWDTLCYQFSKFEKKKKNGSLYNDLFKWLWNDN